MTRARDVSNIDGILTTKGDIYAATAAATPSRLGVGTNGQVLTAASGQATGLQWATPGGALAIAQIASGSMSGTSVTLSGLSSYDYLYLKLNGATASTAQPQLIRINNSSSDVYRMSGNLTDNTGSITRYDSNYGTEIAYSNNNAVSAGNTGQRLGIAFTNCKSAGFTTYQANGGQIGTTTYKYDFNGIYLTAEAVSSLVISCNGGTFNGGTYVLWGA